MSNLLICILGTSGSGKSTIANRLENKYGYKSVRSYTTRPMRNAEEDAQTHTFISDDEVEGFVNEMIAYNKYNGYHYFATKTQLDTNDIYVTDKPGLEQVKLQYGGKDMIAVYIDCNSSIAAQRMSRRGDSDDKIMERLQYDAVAFKGAKDECAFVCLNENQDDLNDVCEFIHSLFRYYNNREGDKE